MAMVCVLGLGTDKLQRGPGESWVPNIQAVLYSKDITDRELWLRFSKPTRNEATQLPLTSGEIL